MARRLTIPAGTPWNPEQLLGPELYRRGGGAILSQMSRAGELGDYAATQQGIIDSAIAQTRTSLLGLPGAPPTPQAGVGSVLPPGMQDPLTGAFKLPEVMRAQLRRSNVDPDLIEGTVNRNLHARMGGDYQQRLAYGQNIANPADKSQQEAKEQLFSKVQRAIEAQPDAKDRIMEAAFSGPNSDQLLAEYDARLAKQAHDGGFLDDLIGGASKIGQAGITSMGQMLSGLQGGWDVVQDSIATLVGARHEGRPVTAADVGAEIRELPKDILNIATQGVAGLVNKNLRTTHTGPTTVDIGRTMRTRGRGDEIASLLHPLMGLSRAGDQIPGPVGDVVAEVFGFAGDVATDPTTYLTLGYGGMGKAATRFAGNAAGRAKFLSHLGLDDMVGRMAGVDEFTWRNFTDELATEVDPAKIAEATDVAKAFRISAESAHGAQGWAGYKAALEGQGLSADALFPRGIVALGSDAKLAATKTQVRGGVGLRGGIGIPGTGLQLRGSINLRPGSGVSRGVRPMGTWFTREGNRFHQLSSATLNNVSQVFHYGAEGADREWIAHNQGLFNATMEAGVLGQGVEARFQKLDEEAAGIGDRISKWLGSEEENPTRLTDVIEKGERSDYWALVPEEIRREGERLFELKDTARSLAAAEGIDIPMLREISEGDEQMLRHFPHKVIQRIGDRVGFPVTPTQVGASRARGVRAGTQITGPQGTSAMLAEGSMAEVNDVTRRILGEGILESDPVKVIRAYLGSLGAAAGLHRTYRTLTESGLLLPDVWDVAPGAGVRKGDPVRGLWTQPADKAARAVKEAQEAVAQLPAEFGDLMRRRAIGHTEYARLDAELAMYASRHADADAKISALHKSRDEKAQMLAIAQTNRDKATAEAKRLHGATRNRLILSTREELGSTREAKLELGRKLAALDKAHAASLAEHDRALAAQREVLGTTPAEIKKGLRAQIETLAGQSQQGMRPLAEVRSELRAAKHRLAQVEGAEMAAGEGKSVIRRAQATARAQRAPIVARQREAAKAAANLNDQITLADQRVKAAQRASDPAAETAATGDLTRLMALRADHLQTAERLSAEAAELHGLIDAGEANMRIAELREAEVLGHKAGANLELQAHKMSEDLRRKMTRLLEAHTKSLVAEANQIITATPRLKFLLRAEREFSVVDTSVPAIPKIGIGRAAADFAQEYMAHVEQRADDLRGAWDEAVGDPAQAYEQARAEGTRQMSALLARELDLVDQLRAAQNADPQAQLLATHQVQGDQLNFFQAELHKNERELEWWMANRSEVRKTQTLKSLQLGAVIRENEDLARKVGAAQRLLDNDQQAASAAMEAALADARIYDLLRPQVEEMTAVVGNLPFIEGQAAMPQEVARVVENVMGRGGENHTRLLKTMNLINSRWKRLTLSTPGSMFRRWFGNVYNASVLAGVRTESFGKALDAMGRAKEAKTLDKIADPKLRHYLELAFEYDIFEGQLSKLATDTHRFRQTAGAHPWRTYQELVQIYAMRGEDIARLAQFIDGLDSGMGPHAARMWTGKYHFFNNELTQAERTALRPLYPFYAYLKNNFALQFHTLFTQPGKISLYGHVMRDMAAQPEGSTAPGWVEQSGGFPITQDTWLQNSLLDTSPLGFPQTILGIASRGAASGWSPTDLLGGELTSSMSPAITTGLTLATGVDPSTGQPVYPQDLPSSMKPITGALQALGLVNDAGKVNPRAMAAFQNLAPMGGRLARVAGGTPAQQEQGLLRWLSSQLAGPGFQRQGERRARSDYLSRGRVLDDLIASMNARGVQVPTTADLTTKERTELALRQLGIGR